MTIRTGRALAEDLFNLMVETGLTEDAAPFGGHVFVARRNEGDLRFQIFRDGDPTPFGVVEAHRCEYLDNSWQLRVYDPAGRPVGEPSGHGEDHPEGGCVGTYHNALNHLRMAALGLAGEAP